MLRKIIGIFLLLWGISIIPMTVYQSTVDDLSGYFLLATGFLIMGLTGLGLLLLRLFPFNSKEEGRR